MGIKMRQNSSRKVLSGVLWNAWHGISARTRWHTLSFLQISAVGCPDVPKSLLCIFRSNIKFCCNSCPAVVFLKLILKVTIIFVVNAAVLLYFFYEGEVFFSRERHLEIIRESVKVRPVWLKRGFIEHPG